MLRQNQISLKQLLLGLSNPDLVKHRLVSLPYDFSERKLELGQWIDAKDTIDQWLEAEITDIRENEIFIHYNGWGRRWDEWIDMNSQRLAPFRTYTVQSPYSMFMSPHPSHSLDGDRSSN